MLCPKAIMKCSQKYLLVGMDDLNGILFITSKVVPHRFRGALKNVEEVGGKHLFMPAD